MSEKVRSGFVFLGIITCVLSICFWLMLFGMVAADKIEDKANAKLASKCVTVDKLELRY